MVSQAFRDAEICPVQIDSVELGLLELYTREYIYRIHVRRVVALKKISNT